MDDSRSTENTGAASASAGAGGVSHSALGGPPISEFYSRGSHLYSTRTSEAFEGIDSATGQRVVLWMLRYPLASDSETALHFVRRLEQIRRLEAPIPRFFRYGVDSRGTAYVVTEYTRARSLFEQAQNPKLLERTFVEMLQTVAPLHKAGIALGDISLDSFALDEQGRVLLMAVLGPFETGAKQTAILPPPETIQFLAPEQRSLSGADSAADVYALGVFAYRLFTGRFLHADKPPTASAEEITAIAAAPSSIRNDLPLWVDDILGRCLEAKPENRYTDARQILQVLFESVQSGVAPGGGSRWSRRTLMVTPSQRDQAIRPRALSKRTHELSTETAGRSRSEIEADVSHAVNVFTWVVALLAGVLGAGLLFVFFDKWNGGAKEDECSIITHAEYAPPELKPLIFDLTAEGVTLEKRQEALQKISQSKDPIAYAILLALTKCRAEAELKSSAEQLLVQRIRDQGSVRSADVLGHWLESIEQANQTPADLPVYTLLLRACDLGRPLDTRQQALREAAALDANVALELAAALSLDEKEDHFLPILRGFLLERSPGVRFESRGIGALIFSNSLLTGFFANELPQMLPKFSDDDLLWLLDRFSESDNSLGIEVAKEALSRKAVPPFQAVFLKALVDSGRGKSFGGIEHSLLRAALGKISRDDVMQFGRWMSLEVEPVLLAACATISNPDLGVDAFDILAARSLETEPANSLVKWIKAQYWDYRRKLVKPIGILGLIEIAGEADLNYAFGELMPFAGNGNLFHVIRQTGDERLIRMALDRMGEITPADELLELLGHKSKSVRIAAVKALKGRNELSILQGILQAYAREKDEDVREVYRETHWVTKDRNPDHMIH
jgi:serine/threonine protein kinase